MPNIPDQPVFRRIEDIMDGRRQLDNAKAGAQVTSSRRDGADRFGSQFICQLAQLIRSQVAQIRRNPDGVEQRCIGSV